MTANPRLTNHSKHSARTDLARRATEAAHSVGRLLARDPLATFLLLTSIGLVIAFFTLLGNVAPGAEGHKVSLSSLNQLAAGQQVRSATLLDHDHQVVAFTSTGLKLYADYPSSDAATLQVYSTLVKGGANVNIDPQSGKAARQIVVQFLIPILLLVSLFALFTRQQGKGGAGGIASFSNFRGRGKRKKDDSPITFASVAGAGEALAELREIRDFLDDPTKYL